MITIIYLTNIDLNQNELQNAIIQPINVLPSTSDSKVGRIVTHNDGTNVKIKWFNGTEWKTVGVIVEDATAGDGVITVDGVNMTVYTLPKAAAGTLGGIKIGTGISIDANGVASVPDLSNKVDKVTGKGLSTNDYDSTEKSHVSTAYTHSQASHAPSNAQKNVQSDWNQTTNTADDFILHKPTKLSDFTNDENFIDNTVNNLTNYYKKTETYTQSEVNTLIGNLATITLQIVASLPASGSSNIIYLVPTTGASPNAHDEYLWTGTAFEKIGTTEVDLSNYLTKTGNASKATVTFTQAATRTNIVTGEALDVLMGKFAKAFADLKTVAFSGNYSDLLNKPTLAKSGTFNITTSQSTNSATYSGTSILNVLVKDSVSNDIVFCDIDINGMVVTVSTAANPTNTLNVIVTYI